MAKYGALISLPNGNPFITPDSTPMTLYRKVTVNSTFGGNFNSASASVTIDGQKGGIAFETEINAKDHSTLRKT